MFKRRAQKQKQNLIDDLNVLRKKHKLIGCYMVTNDLLIVDWHSNGLGIEMLHSQMHINYTVHMQNRIRKAMEDTTKKGKISTLSKPTYFG